MNKKPVAIDDKVRYGGVEYRVTGIWTEAQKDAQPSLTIKAAVPKPDPKPAGFRAPVLP